jgi:hypothetical protein
MAYDCVDICDKVYEVMCLKCLNHDACQNAEDDVNHGQMIICMDKLVTTEYPAEFEPMLTGE